MTVPHRLRGLGVALATPFGPASGAFDPAVFGAGAVDLDAWRRLVRHVVADGRGADFLVVLGSTGEGPTVLPEERDLLLRAAKEECRGLPIVAGTGHNATPAAVELARRAVDCGADALLVVTPYYNKPQPAGVEAHFRAVAAAVPGTPLLVYNVPGRTGQNLLPKDLARLWAVPDVVGVKESSGNLAQIGEIVRTLPEGKVVLSGDDALALPTIALGAHGLISVAGNAVPRRMRSLVEAALAGDMARARAEHSALLPLMDALFLETNPAPVKAVLEALGLCAGLTRLPVLPASDATRARLAELLAKGDLS